jgi:PAS domain S-box-containing protein
MLSVLMLVGAIILQISAAFIAIRLIRVTGRLSAWVFISVALVLMAVRRIIPLARQLIDARGTTADPLNEFVGLLLSGFMLGGIAMIGPIFRRIFQSEKELGESERRFRSYFELPLIGVAIASADRRLMTVNDRLCEILGFPRHELAAMTIGDLTFPEDAERELALEGSVAEGAAEGYSLDKRFIRKDGTSVWTSQAVRCVRDPEGAPAYHVVIVQDIEEKKTAEEGLRHSLSDKEALLRELYHRTKNNMQLICSLLRLESAHSGDPRVAEEFQVIENKIFSMSLVHEKLYLSRDLSNISLSEYVEDLSGLLMQSYAAFPDRISLEIDLASVRVPIDTAIPFGLIMNELVTNALKHGFPDGRKGRVRIGVAETGGDLIELVISDDGVGVPPGFNFDEAQGMGLKTVLALAEQLQGQVRFIAGQGVECRVTFRIAELEPRV